MNRENPIHKTKQGTRTGLFLDNHTVVLIINAEGMGFLVRLPSCFSFIPLSFHRAGSRNLKGGAWRSHERVPAKQARLPRGIRGHPPPPPGKFWKKWCKSVHSGSDFADVQRHEIYSNHSDNHLRIWMEVSYLNIKWYSENEIVNMAFIESFNVASEIKQWL